jgi:hypothetical protein
VCGKVVLWSGEGAHSRSRRKPKNALLELEILENFLFGLKNAEEKLLDGALYAAIWFRRRLSWNPVLLPIGSHLIPPVLPSFQVLLVLAPTIVQLILPVPAVRINPRSLKLPHLTARVVLHLLPEEPLVVLYQLVYPPVSIKIHLESSSHLIEHMDQARNCLLVPEANSLRVLALMRFKIGLLLS